MGNKKNLNSQQSARKNDTKDYNSFKVVLFYCLLIIFFPVFTFFSIKTFLFDNYFNLEPIRSNIYSAVSAVIALHIALGLYIYKAYFGADDYSPAGYKKQD